MKWRIDGPRAKARLAAVAAIVAALGAGLTALGLPAELVDALQVVGRAVAGQFASNL